MGATRTTTEARDTWVTVVWKSENREPKYEYMLLEAYVDNAFFKATPHVAFLGKCNPIVEISSFPMFQVTREE
jgi:hypothetical protein